MKSHKNRIRKIGEALPPPTHCRYCGQRVHFVNNEELYGKPFGPWPFGYLCGFCEAYVGCHKGTRIPLGIMATAALRQLRAKAHEAFDPLWKSGRLSRGAAYRMLAERLGIPPEQCHISWFDREEVDRVLVIAPELCRKLKVPGYEFGNC